MYTKFFLLFLIVMSSFFFIRLTKERERMETVGTNGAIYQSLWWACHNMSVIVTGFHCLGNRKRLLLWLSLFVWYHAPHIKISSIGTWQWPTDTQEEWNLFHGYFKLSITSRIAHIYAYTIMRRDKNTYMKYLIINNIINHIWIIQVK